MAAWSAAGWRVVVVRVTDDRYDSVGLGIADTISANTREFGAAAAALGVAQIVELGYETDCLGDASEVGLREHMIRQIRTHRPYALVTFDPYAMFGEDNQDHVKVAAAAGEAFWTSQFDKHHPKHLVAGLRPHGCFERWYFGRRLVKVTDVVDITATLQRKIDAACEHRTMLRNYANQLCLQADTGGWHLERAAQALATGDVRPLMEPLLRAGAARVGDGHGVAAAEEFRVVTFGGLSGLLERWGTRR